MQNALYLEVSFVGICLLVIILFNQHQDIGSSTLQRQFNLLVYSIILMLILDAVCWLLDGAMWSGARSLIVLSQTLYYFLNIMIPYLWLVYVEFTLNKKQRGIFRRLRLLAIPMAALMVLLIINLHSNTVFIIDENNVYHRQQGYLLYAALAYLYLGYATVHALIAAHRASWVEEKRRYYPMAAFVIMPAVGGIIQIFYYGIALIWIFVAISTMLLYLNSLKRQISTDPLTGINNRRELTKFLLRETRDYTSDTVLALVMMDVDGFKRVNDTYGHYYGDSVLTSVSDILKQSCKNSSAFLARYGGDEFCIVYPTDTVKAVEGLINRIQAQVEVWNENSTEPVQIRLSIGYSIWNAGKDESVEALYKRADQNMYEEKNKKKGIYMFHQIVSGE